MVRAEMSTGKGTAGKIGVGAGLRLAGIVLCVEGVVGRMRLPRVKKIGPTIRVPQSHGVIRGVTGHPVVVTSAAGQAFHCHGGWVDMHIQLLPEEVCTKSSSAKKMGGKKQSGKKYRL